MERQQFTFYRSYWEAISGLPKKEREIVLEAIINYALDETAPNKLSPVAFAVFTLIRPTLDSGRNKAANRKNKTRTTEEQTENKTTTSEEQNRKEKEKEVEKEVECERERENECYSARKRFTPPTAEEIADYCRERKNGVDAQRFFDFYASKGWKVGDQPMKDWKAAVRTWERRDLKEVPSDPTAWMEKYL